MSPSQWEALCDGCGLCCLHKLQDDDTGEIHYTKVACRLLDCQSCLCKDYKNRKQHVPDCMQLTYDKLEQAQHWLPETCAYKRLYQGKPLPKWHYLICHDKKAVHKAQASAQGIAISETEINDDLEDYLIS